MIDADVHRRRWLCIAHAFPPIHRSGTQRTLSFVRHLDAAGWGATVLTLDPRGEPSDDALLAKVPPRAEIIRASWFDLHGIALKVRRFWTPMKSTTDSERSARRVVVRSTSSEAKASFLDWFSRLLQFPDSRVGWIPSAFRVGLRAIRRRKPELIYSTSPHVSAHLVALLLSRLAKVPWIADFRDPWCANPYRDLPYATLRRWDACLERLVIRHASCVVCNTPAATHDFIRRYPTIKQKFRTIPNGIDFERFAAVRPRRVGRPGEFTVLHSGQFYGHRSPLPLFRAIRRVAERSHGSAPRIRLVLAGGDSFDGRPLADIASAMGIADGVEVLGPVAHSESLSLMAGADTLILVTGAGHGSNLQVPNKLYEYLALRRPILALVPAGNPAREILTDARADTLTCEPADDAGIARAIEQLVDPNRTVPCDAWSGVGKFDRANRARELLELVEELTAGPRRSPRSTDQMPCRMNGFVERSRPIVVAGP